MGAQALVKGIRMAPRKLNPVVALVRGRTVKDALEILENTPRRAALPVKKIISSAVANADYNHGYKPDSLYIAQISVTPGVRYKRWRPAARGRALPYQLKTSHLKVVVDGDKRLTKKTTKKSDLQKESSK